MFCIVLFFIKYNFRLQNDYFLYLGVGYLTFYMGNSFISINTTVGIRQYDDNDLPPRGKRADAPLNQLLEVNTSPRSNNLFFQKMLEMLQH